MTWLFLLAYTCSGMAGLIYEVTWTRLLTLYVGHTTAAASAVVAAFLGGLAIGASLGGRLADRLAPRRCLRGYVLLELAVAAMALLVPFELKAFAPLLRWAYNDGAPGLLFPTIRLVSCLFMVFVPATLLGATFPLAIRWFASRRHNPARFTGILYTMNTVGAAVGSLLAGFTLIPAIGLAATTRLGVGASLIAAGSVWIVSRRAGESSDAVTDARESRPARASRRETKPNASRRTDAPPATVPTWLPAAILGASGCAALVHEIVWTRILALLMGPTTYAFAATLAAVITGLAIGAAAGAVVVGRTRQPATWLALALTGAAITATVTCSLAGGWVPRLVAEQMANSGEVLDQLFREGTLLTAALILPTAFCFGAAFPLALALPTDDTTATAERFGLIYAINTVGSVVGSLLAGFVLIPAFGLQTTLKLVSVAVVASAGLVILKGRLSRDAQISAGLVGVVVLALTAVSPPWDRALLASGSYLYAPYVPKDLDLETMLKAGSLDYYKEGATATVSVKKLTGTTTLAVDGKVDASDRSDMLTQKLIAHLPLLLHDNPRHVGIVGLGSGVTLGAALRHPVEQVDVVEISQEVVEASEFFKADNQNALADPRARLLVGDGRSHLLLGRRPYDVIISEPSNPWIAGVAALFTKEFFEAARDRLAPGGVVCQWAHTYNINERDLRSIAATFISVFPNGTLWLVGSDDLLLLASNDPIEPRLANIARNFERPGMAAELKTVGISDPFSILSLYGGGPREIQAYGAGAPLLTDDRMTLEFSGPRELHRETTTEKNDAQLFALYSDDTAPDAIKAARAGATGASWRHRAGMLAQSDMHDAAYDDYIRALGKDPHDAESLEKIVREAVLIRRTADALSWVKGLTVNMPPTVPILVAQSKLQAASGLRADAIDSATKARDLDPKDPRGAEQLASIHADSGDINALEQAVATLRASAPAAAPTHYFGAVLAFLRGDTAAAVALGRQAVAADATYAPTYDLLGAAHARLGQLDEARAAFHTSLTFDAHDSAAYSNLGLVEQAAGNPGAARDYFAEALSLAPDDAVARRALGFAR